MNEPFAAYLPHIRQRRLLERQGWETRRLRAWDSARRIAALLRSDFGATQVYAFGSLVGTGRFDARSDIDIGVRGIPPQDFYRAAARAFALAAFDVDIVDMQDCAPALLEAIERDGVVL